MMELFLIGISLLVVALVVVILVVQSQNRDELRNAIRAYEQFAESEVLTSANSAIACDSASSLYAVAWRAGGNVLVKFLTGSELIDVTVETVGQSSTTTKTGFAKLSTQGGAQEINLCVRFRSKDMPIFRIPLYVRVGDHKFGEAGAMNIGRQWESSIMAIAHASPMPSKPQAGAHGVAAEISDLHQLLVSGVLTNEEFATAKAKAITR